MLFFEPRFARCAETLVAFRGILLPPDSNSAAALADLPGIVPRMVEAWPAEAAPDTPLRSFSLLLLSQLVTARFGRTGALQVQRKCSAKSCDETASPAP
jgi:hypothetical protein